MKLDKLLLVSAVFLTSWALAANPLAFKPNSKKVIIVNSGVLSTEKIRQNIREIEERAPVHGIEINLLGKTTVNGKAVTLDPVFHTFTPEPWQYEWFQQDVDNLKNTDFRRLTDNFLRVSCRGKDLTWDDEQGWANIAAKFGIIAKIARETGCVGIRIDPEFYGNQTQFSFAYDPQSGKTYDEAWDLARRRGRQIIDAIAQAYPDITLFFFFGLSLGNSFLDNSDPYTAMQSYRYGLWFGFLNGMYDGMTPGMLFLDGNESAGYTARNELDYMRAYARYKMCNHRLLTPENRAKMAQTETANAMYLDAYFGGKRMKSYDVAPDLAEDDMPARIRHFAKNLDAACKWTDQYVWLYGERGRWWSKDIVAWTWGSAGSVVNYWDVFAPGFLKAVKAVLDPVAAAANSPNLIRNPSFNEPYDEAKLQKAVVDHYPCRIMQWNLYRGKGKTGDFTPAPGQGFQGADGIRAAGFSEMACLSQTIPAQPGDKFVLKAKVRELGQPVAAMMSFHQSVPDRWVWIASDYPPQAEPVALPGDKTWKEITIVLQAPEGHDITAIGIGLVVRTQTPGDDVIFSDVSVRKVDFP